MEKETEFFPMAFPFEKPNWNNHIYNFENVKSVVEKAKAEEKPIPVSFIGDFAHMPAGVRGELLDSVLSETRIGFLKDITPEGILVEIDSPNPEIIAFVRMTSARASLASVGQTEEVSAEEGFDKDYLPSRVTVDSVIGVSMFPEFLCRSYTKFGEIGKAYAKRRVVRARAEQQGCKEIASLLEEKGLPLRERIVFTASDGGLRPTRMMSAGASYASDEAEVLTYRVCLPALERKPDNEITEPTVIEGPSAQDVAERTALFLAAHPWEKVEPPVYEDCGCESESSSPDQVGG